MRVSDLVPEGEILLINPGVKAEIMCHEGPQAGETVETWLRKASAIRIINIAPMEKIKPPQVFGPEFPFTHDRPYRDMLIRGH